MTGAGSCGKVSEDAVFHAIAEDPAARHAYQQAVTRIAIQKAEADRIQAIHEEESRLRKESDVDKLVSS